MSRTFKIMEIEKKEAYVLFDTGSIDLTALRKREFIEF
jgi:hypothetical protein